MDQNKTPLFDRIKEHAQKNSYSFHVPGHKSGQVFPDLHQNPFQEILPFDLTELSGLDDLHQPVGAIREAEALAADLYGVKRTFFLVNGTTSGNLAMILSVCAPGDEVIVQRNSHKSVMNALELAGARPIFITPEYDKEVDRVSVISPQTIQQAIEQHPSAKAVVLTYPDYFGSTYPLEKITAICHEKNIPVLVDEAHGAHFKLGAPFPKSAIDCGADIVVQSAHKTLPALTMGSYLHICSDRVSEKKVARFLQMVQTSSPSYLVMASLDLARYFMATRTREHLEKSFDQIRHIRQRLSRLENVSVQPIREGLDDPFKITLVSDSIDLHDLSSQFESHGIFPEMVQNNQLLLIHGFHQDRYDYTRLERAIKSINTLKKRPFHGKIKRLPIGQAIQRLEISYEELHHLDTVWVEWSQAIGQLSAETVIPYPPGIPLIVKGERIREEDVRLLTSKEQHFQSIQYDGQNLQQGILIIVER